MDKIESRLASHEVLGEVRVVCQIGLPDLYSGLRGPLSIHEFSRRTNKAANLITFVNQTRREAATDITGCTGNRNASRAGEFRQR
jgi:hypothetical protein